MIPKKIQLIEKSRVELPKGSYLMELFYIRSYLVGVRKENDFYKRRIKLLEKLRDNENSDEYDEVIKQYKKLIEDNINNYVRELFNYKVIKGGTFNFL